MHPKYWVVIKFGRFLKIWGVVAFGVHWVDNIHWIFTTQFFYTQGVVSATYLGK